MGLIVISARDLQRIEILSKVIGGSKTLASADHILDLSTRLVRRLLDRVRTTEPRRSGIKRVVNRPTNCGLTLAAEKLECLHDYGHAVKQG